MFITDHCEDPAKAMKWIDKFYDKENTLINYYGMKGKTFKDEDGIFKWNVDYANANYEGNVSKMTSWETVSTKFGYWNSDIAENNGDIGTLVEDNKDMFGSYRVYWEQYKDYIDPETWPRPYYHPDDSKELSEIQTDIHNFVEEKKAAWIMGGADVDAEWDSYLDKMEELNVAKYLKINQDAHDVYQKALEEISK